jgi:hypothetical protein
MVIEIEETEEKCLGECVMIKVEEESRVKGKVKFRPNLEEGLRETADRSCSYRLVESR